MEKIPWRKKNQEKQRGKNFCSEFYEYQYLKMKELKYFIEK